MLNRPEILAPAGNMEALHAAVHAGADACYIGGEQYSARAFAGNFSRDELLAAIDFCHIHDVKLYLAVNTLLKNEEINRLVSYLEPFYLEGADGVIVQDVGVIRLLSRAYPDLPLHGSTQMSVCSRYGAEFLKTCGLTRIVPAREISLNEIKKIKESVDIEIETFVHGAMCFSYSGKCLMSSFAGGRSGNRGRCAQPCRKPYNSPAFHHEYALSMKDMCLLQRLPLLIQAGIDSFKIEGRMKKPEYVAAAVSAYSEVTGAVLAGTATDRLISEHISRLMDIYNRGGFSSGYYWMRNGKEMLANKRPNHTGTLIGSIVSVIPPEIKIKLAADLNERDVLEIRTGAEPVELTSNVTAGKECVASLRASGLRKLRAGMKVYRTRNNQLLEELRDSYMTKDKQRDVYGTVTAHAGRPLTLTLFSSWNDVTVCAAGEIVEHARKQPVTAEQMIDRLSKTGGTQFRFYLEADADADCFVPVGQLNALRRKAVKMLEDALVDSGRRTLPETDSGDGHKTESKDQNKSKLSFLTASVHTLEQLRIADECPIVDRVVLDASVCRQAELGKRTGGKPLLLALPEIFRESRTKELKELLFLSGMCDGVCIKNMDELGFLKAMNYRGAVMMDSLLYAYNNEAASFFREQFDNVTLIAPVELTHQELLGLDGAFAEKLYGYQPVMITAQCFVKNYKQACRYDRMELLSFQDELGNRFYAVNICADCYSVIYNGIPTDNTDRLKKLADPDIMNEYLIEFTIETAEQTRNVLSRLMQRERNSFISGDYPDEKRQASTRGHDIKGID